MSDFAGDIRRIAKKDKQKSSISSKGARDPVLGTVTPFEDDAFSTVSTGNESSAGSDPCSPADTGGGDPINPDDPNTFKQPVPGTDGTPTGEEYNNGTGPTFDNNPTGGDTEYPTGGYGSLNGLDGLYDCVTDEQFNLGFGDFPDQSGWDDPESPPVDETYQSDYYWQSSSNDPATRATTPKGSFDLTPQAGCWDGSSTQVAADRWDYGLIPGCWGASVQWTINRQACLTDTSDYCVDIPTEECWAADGITSVALIDGAFKTSEYDCDAAPFEEKSHWTPCESPGGVDPMDIQAGADDGRIISTGVGTDDAITRVYWGKGSGKEGQLRAVGDTTTTFIQPYLP